MTHLGAEELESLRVRLVARTDPRAVAALIRLRKDELGLCVRGGEELEFAMLDAAPDLVLCTDCDEEARKARESSRHGICGMKQP